MEFFNSAVDVLQTLVIALGAGLGIWGVINLLEGYGNVNPGANAHGIEALQDSSHTIPNISVLNYLCSVFHPFAFIIICHQKIEDILQDFLMFQQYNMYGKER